MQKKFWHHLQIPTYYGDTVVNVKVRKLLQVKLFLLITWCTMVRDFVQLTACQR